MISISWTTSAGEPRVTTFKASTAARFIKRLEACGYEWNIVAGK